MKNIIYALAILFSLNVVAQEGSERSDKKGKREMSKEFMQNLSPKELATLHTKKLTLALDLSDKQQAQVLALQTKVATERKAKMEAHKAKKEKGEKPSKEERYKMMNERLDAKIAYKKNMKEILSDEQYTRWEKMQARKGKGKKKRKGKRKRQE
ncbi:hypothetical protein [uncultured Kordia sp.]|uniref:hypothetical protein n=1 Tax=uncultured Kordia sp. TaxID=507699 RepID=UPI002629F994|nr:hypothetical protein [uncultured Kordia sp.]